MRDIVSKCCTAIVASLIFGLCSCTVHEGNIFESDSGDFSGADSGLQEDITEEGKTPEQLTIYDFAELSDKDFPRGAWTVNKAIERYGEPEQCVAKYFADYRVVTVVVTFEEIEVDFWYAEPKRFSFYTETLAEGEYALSDNDKDLELEVFSFLISGSKFLLPRGIELNQSTMAEIIDAYPEPNPYYLKSEEYGYEFISYKYTFFDEDGTLPDNILFMETDEGRIYQTGHISYYFDENEILNEVEVEWYFADL